MLDEGVALFMAPPPAVDPSVVVSLQERVETLERLVQRLRDGPSTPSDDASPSIIGHKDEGLNELRKEADIHGPDGWCKSVPVTGTAHHHIKWECEAAFKNLCAEFRRDQAKQFPGFLGMTTLHGKSHGLSDSQEYVNIFKYSSLEEMEVFAKSSLRQRFLERLTLYVQSPSTIIFEQGRYMHDAFSELFVNPGEQAPSQPPPVWKSCFLVQVGLLMCVWPVNQNLTPVLLEWGLHDSWAVTLVLTAINVALNTWICVPFLIFLFGGWLNKPRDPPHQCFVLFLDRGFANIWAQLAASALYFGGLIALIITQPL